MKSLPSNSNEIDPSRGGLAGARWREIRDGLLKRKSRIFAEIRDYPVPITACDAQFNHLIEQRDAIRAELRSLEGLIAEGTGGEQALVDFVRSSVFLGKGEDGVSGAG